MKLSSKDTTTIECLIKIEKRIGKLYLEACVTEDKSIICKRLKGLIEMENNLIDSINIKEKFKEIVIFLKDKARIDVEPVFSTALNYGLNDQNYPYYRLYAKCKYKFTFPHKAHHLELNEVRRELMETETELIYTSLYCYAVDRRMCGDFETASIIDLTSYYVLMDHPKFELERIEEELSEPEFIQNGLGLSTDVIIRNYIEIVKQNYFGGNAKITNDPYQDAYDLMITRRIKEIFSTLVIELRNYISNHENYREMDMYYLLVSYLKALISMCKSEQRNYLYESLESYINDCTTDRRKEFLEILKSEIENIESNMVNRINNVFLHPGIRS